jgi:hypothetical protein
MSKAKELKQAFEWGKKNDLYNLDFPDVDWLIEQAEKVERYEKALEFYANKEHYYVPLDEMLDPTFDYIHLVDMDEGDKARKALLEVDK